MKNRNTLSALLRILLASFVVHSAAAMAEVKITPLGSQEGEFCQLDRALILEDPDGTRILYDPGRTVAGADDPRLGNIDAILISHMHPDHVGDKHIEAVGFADCNSNSFPINALPNTNAVNIALSKNAKIITGSEMPQFFASKLQALGGDPKNSQLVRFGASRQLGGVTITTVPAAHSNGISGLMIGGEIGAKLNAVGLTAYAGPATGYVLKFSNGLVVYLSGDTGITAEQKSVVADHYRAKLVVINIGDTFTTGPVEAAWVVNELIMPNAVIVSHANQPSTSGGEVIAGTRVDEFSQLTAIPVHVPLSGLTMVFDGEGNLQ
jgi:L-ascorbate metabolism protein UlaG (beta-lactamase superfamily)